MKQTKTMLLQTVTAVLCCAITAGASACKKGPDDAGKAKSDQPAKVPRGAELAAPPKKASVAPTDRADRSAKPVPVKHRATSHTAPIAVSATSMGPIRFGMSRKAVEALKLKTHPQYSAMTIPYTVYYAGDSVSGISVSLQYAGGDVMVNGTMIPKNATFGQAMKAVGDCVRPDLSVGGTTATCKDGIKVTVGSGSPKEIWIRIDQPATKPAHRRR